MTNITIAADENLVEALKTIAEQKATTVEVVAREALADYVRSQPARTRTYSFIGLFHSGKKNLSTQVEKIIEENTLISLHAMRI